MARWKGGWIDFFAVGAVDARSDRSGNQASIGFGWTVRDRVDSGLATLWAAKSETRPFMWPIRFHRNAQVSCDPPPFFEPPEGRVSRPFHYGGLVAPPALSNVGALRRRELLSFKRSMVMYIECLH